MSGEGLIVRDAVLADEQERIRELQQENRQLRDELRVAKAEVSRVHGEAGRAVAELRRVLTPLYRSLQVVFGEMDAVSTEMPASGADARDVVRYQSWKARLGPQCGKIIDELLAQPGMNTTQLAIAIGTRRQNIPPLIFKLNQAGLIEKHGDGRFSLKALS